MPSSAAMRWRELRAQLRQEGQKRLERIAYAAGIDLAAREFQPLTAPRATRATARSVDANLPSASQGQFFFPTAGVPAILEILRERFPRECELTLEEAGQICRHRFDLLGFEGLDYGNVIDWHLDAAHGKRAPRRPWYKLERAEVGGRRIIWEINRHQHLVTLAKAHLLSREPRFLTELLEQWRGWQRANRYPIGINWLSGLETAFRSLSWLWIGHLLAASPNAPKSFQHELVRGLAANALRIEHYLPKTASTGEATALFFIGVLCPRLRSAARWRETGWRLLLEQASETAAGIGSSINEHVSTIDFLLHARILAARNNRPIPEALDRSIERRLEFLVGVSQAGTAPRFGDGDQGRVFNARRNHLQHMLDPLAIAAALYGRADFKAASNGLTEEAVWLLGPAAVRCFDNLGNEDAPSFSTAFPASGFYVMASRAASPSCQRRQLVIAAQRLRPSRLNTVDSDALSVQVSVNGNEWLVDPGIGASHNSLFVDGAGLSHLAAAGADQGSPPVEIEQWVTGKQFDLFLGRRNCGAGRPVIHQRWVFHLKSQFWLVRDVADGNGEHDFEIFWHFAPDFTPSYTPPGFTLLRRPDPGQAASEAAGLAMVPAEGHGWSQEIRRGGVSPVYGLEEAAPVVCFQTHSSTPVEFATLLQPVIGDARHTGKLMRSRVQGVTCYSYETRETQHAFFFSEGAAPWEMGGWKSDARFIYAGASKSAGQPQIALCGGSFLEIDGQRTLACGRAVSQCEIFFNGSRQEIHCPDPLARIEFTEESLSGALL